jgi:hypothetical protein
MTDEDSKDHNDIPVRARRTRHLVASATEKNKFGTSLVNKNRKSEKEKENDKTKKLFVV